MSTVGRGGRYSLLASWDDELAECCSRRPVAIVMHRPSVFRPDSLVVVANQRSVRLLRELCWLLPHHHLH